MKTTHSKEGHPSLISILFSLSSIGFLFLLRFFIPVTKILPTEAPTDEPMCVLETSEDLCISSLLCFFSTPLGYLMALLISLEEPFLAFFNELLMLREKCKITTRKRDNCDPACYEVSFI